MSETKIFRKKDLDLEPVNGMKTIGLVNVSFSDKLGAGIGVFEDCSIPWHITYDEVISILEGQFTLQVGDKIFEAGLFYIFNHLIHIFHSHPTLMTT